ncbi:hypothetical protein GCM10007860_24280 [Chitiniphilus shinanonensis]|uniref:Uncharacterized protein n=1 Tax=Chitiniphilus shinanonensis TaxID=553088 RepID=A0ABQ6BUC7_9NEIS|nr:hypothetical protein [Chitiniphilus shinanonensis]GLS05278.1 hypothetical protein GCM10007860_24280 [Chitiniphilus shinanonensis]
MARKKTSQLPAEYGGFVLTFEPERTTWIAERFHSEMRLTESFSAVDWRFDHRELVFLVLEHEPLAIGGFALMEPMHGSGGSMKRKMRMHTPLLEFHPALSSNELKVVDLAARLSTPERMQRLDATDWHKLIAQVKACRPSDAAAIDLLIAKRTEQRLLPSGNQRYDRLNEQRDGLGLVLDIGKQDRAKTLKSLQVDRVDSATSILSLLDDVLIQERSLLEHDRRVFEQLFGEKNLPSQWANFDDQQGHKVRVTIVDKTALETVLGIDLIIYHTCYQSFLLLQYKRMTKNAKGKWTYPISPSSRLHDQLKKTRVFMNAAADTQAPAPTLWNYRLNEDPFFFKFCQEHSPTARNENLIPGITLSADHLSHFLTLPESEGEGDGRLVGYHNCPRYLNNTEFTQLAQMGWIGAGVQSAELMRKVLEANRAGNRSAMFAVIESPQDKSAMGRLRRR